MNWELYDKGLVLVLGVIVMTALALAPLLIEAAGYVVRGGFELSYRIRRWWDA